MPDTYGYRSTRPEPGNGGLGAAPRGPDGRVVILLVGGRGEQNRNLSEYTDGIWGSNPLWTYPFFSKNIVQYYIKAYTLFLSFSLCRSFRRIMVCVCAFVRAFYLKTQQNALDVRALSGPAGKSLYSVQRAPCPLTRLGERNGSVSG